MERVVPHREVAGLVAQLVPEHHELACVERVALVDVERVEQEAVGIVDRRRDGSERGRARHDGEEEHAPQHCD